MYQISPAPSASAEAARRGTAFPSFRQAALIGRFDVLAHLQGDLDAVACEACRVAAEGTGAGIAGVLQYRADEDAFVLQAGVGWPARMVGRTRVAADLSTTAGLAWLAGQLVQFHELNATDRTRVPEAIVGHGMHRIVSVPIRGEGQRAFGVLEVGSVEAGEFTRHDLSFLQGIANGVAMAVKLHASRTEQAELAVKRRAALADWLDVAAGRQGPAGVSYQQDAQSGAG